MPKAINWMYFRTHCMTCKKAKSYLDEIEAKPAAEIVNATKVRMGEAEALNLAGTVDKIVAAKGKKIVTLNLKKDPPAPAEILAVMIGPTGNLRAPTARIGKTLLIGFNKEAYREVIG